MYTISHVRFQITKLFGNILPSSIQLEQQTSIFFKIPSLLYLAHYQSEERNTNRNTMKFILSSFILSSAIVAALTALPPVVHGHGCMERNTYGSVRAFISIIHRLCVLCVYQIQGHPIISREHSLFLSLLDFLLTVTCTRTVRVDPAILITHPLSLLYVPNYTTWT